MRIDNIVAADLDRVVGPAYVERDNFVVEERHGVSPGGGNYYAYVGAIGVARETTDFDRLGWVGDVDDPQTAGVIGQENVPAEILDAVGAAGGIQQSDDHRRGLIGDVQNTQAGVVSREVHVVADKVHPVGGMPVAYWMDCIGNYMYLTTNDAGLPYSERLQ